MPSRPEQDLAPRNPHQIPADEVRLSDWARSFVATLLIYLPPPDRPGGDSDLTSSIRKVGEFFKEHPEIVKSSFGKSVQSLMHGAVHLVKGGGAGGHPPAAKENLLESVRRLYGGLQSFRSMRRIEASLRKASALRLRFSQSLANRGQRLSQGWCV